ncbi:hypothetical protein DdX_01024 [Ditylenchus destructor]|uniref:Uncharacterized protein n=1 Tax=Ditylenchus destructor TaxID=166010 RepID=A0AAD4NIH3_9BILA|nr:hypothetical protein DdX_01024 [Ditylenchus destructor]
MAPISAMYDEGALDGLFDMFGAGYETQDQERLGDDFIDETRNGIKADAEESVVNSKLFLTLSVPWVTAELRSRKSALLSPNITGMVPTILHNYNTASTPFALAILEGLDVSLINSERFLSKLKLSFQSICLDDLFETNTKWPLLKSASVNGDNNTNWPGPTAGIVNVSLASSYTNLA